MSPPDSVAYKVLTAPQYASFRERGVFAGAPVDLADGFIHLSAQDQLAGTVDKHFAGQEDLYLLTIDLRAAEAAHPGAVRWEVSRGGALFPHVYAPLAWDWVRGHGPLERLESGAICLPPMA
ncbi:DUF952 domain-containing protein [Novosphingobium sp. FSY-8]|uniref:DUF952 domain-containing protein n=1 Tax=Novosphingobium ovatum TaxID=1908523 RepID=A0ABW9XCG5_9SPHN|nr:DUF952 domain-containing protein [Novosphingobium ovatum]NBC36221.1 DUF952 domain-containing protein [Novosphingobium ovatum]